MNRDDPGTASPRAATNDETFAPSVWVGGLVALLAAARWDRIGLPVAARRFSAIAVVCFAAVAVTGLLNAWLRAGSIDNLAGTGYGVLLQVKLLALCVLGGFGWWHRQQVLPTLAAGPGRFVRFATVEVVVMAATVGVAVGLSRAQAPGTLDVTGLTTRSSPTTNPVLFGDGADQAFIPAERCPPGGGSASRSPPSGHLASSL